MNLQDELQKELVTFEKEISKASDSIYATLISHLYIEHLLDRYLIAKLPKGDALVGERDMSFSNKLKLVKALGDCENQLHDSISKLNKLRNNCAHSFAYQLTEKEVDDLGRTLGKEYTRMKKDYSEIGSNIIVPVMTYICGLVLNLTIRAEKCITS